MIDKVRGTYTDNIQTYDLNIPTWPFYAVAILGFVSLFVLMLLRVPVGMAMGLVGVTGCS